MNAAICKQPAPDQRFSNEQIERLEHLMARWRSARDGGPALTEAESAELDQLVELETLADGERGADVAFSSVGTDVRRL